jgi:large subunit ribosomal protein L25
MEEVNLKAQLREKLGSAESRRIRENDLIPAVLYGRKDKPLHLVISLLDLKKVISGGENLIINLKVKDGTETVMIKDVQYNPVDDKIDHVDLYRVSMQDKVKVGVPIEIIGVAKGVREKGGVLEQIMREIQIESLPANIPDKIEIDVTSLDIGDTISAGQLKITEKVTLLTSPESLVVGVMASTKLEEKKPAEEEAAAAEPELIKKEKKDEDEEAKPGEAKAEISEKEKGEKGKPEKGKPEKGK